MARARLAYKYMTLQIQDHRLTYRITEVTTPKHLDLPEGRTRSPYYWAHNYEICQL